MSARGIQTYWERGAMLHKNLRGGDKNPGSSNIYIHERLSVDYQENREKIIANRRHTFKARMHQIRFLVSVRLSVCVLDGV